MKKALIMVDIQNDFLPSGALPVPEGDKVVPLTNALQKHFDIIVATQDWHPENHGSFAQHHPGHHPGDMIDLHGIKQILWPVHCVQNTNGAEFAPGLAMGRVTKIIQKGTDPTLDSYSGFFDNAHRRATGLEEYLKSEQVDEVYVVGLATDYCVKFTVLDAITLGFKTHLIEDVCRGVGLTPQDIPNALQEMQTAGATLLQSLDVITEEK